MEIEMPRAEAEPGPGRDRGDVAQHAVLEAVDLERAGVLGLAGGGIVAARHQDRGLVPRRGENLVGVYAGIWLAWLAHHVAERAVALDAMHRDVARIVVGGEQVFARGIDAGVDRTRRQRLRLAMGLQGAGLRIDAGRGGEGVCAGPAPGRR